MTEPLEPDAKMETDEVEENFVFRVPAPANPSFLPPILNPVPQPVPLAYQTVQPYSTFNSTNASYSNALPFQSGFSFSSNPRLNLSNPYYESMKLDNDEPLIFSEQIENSNLPEDPIAISIQSLYNKLKLGDQEVELPCVVSVIGGNADIETIEKNRQGIDLVFVVDISGSMGGQKIELVKITLEFVLSKLKKYDRVCIIAFTDAAYILCPLTVMSESGKDTVTEIIRSLDSTGGTNMESGIGAALHVLADRKMVNQTTSVLMLSDGVDNDVRTVNQRIKQRLDRLKFQIGSEFRLHTFGYGRDHDSRVMNKLAEENNGNFYYVETEISIADAFGNCLGELVSLVASNIQVTLTTLPCDTTFRLHKVYSATGDTVFHIPSVYFNDKKDSVFILKFSPIETPLTVDRISPVEVSISYALKSGLESSKNQILVIEIAQEGQEIIKNTDVLLEFYRVKSADALKEITSLADSGNLVEAQAKAKAAEEEIKQSEIANNPKIQALIRDLRDAQLRVASKNSWESGGRAQVTSIQNSHFSQKASSNCATYQNALQANYSLSANIYVSNNISKTAPPQVFNSVPVPPAFPGPPNLFNTIQPTPHNSVPQHILGQNNVCNTPNLHPFNSVPNSNLSQPNNFQAYPQNSLNVPPNLFGSHPWGPKFSGPIHGPPSIGNQPAPLIPAQQSLFVPNKDLSGLNKIPDNIPNLHPFNSVPNSNLIQPNNFQAYPQNPLNVPPNLFGSHPWGPKFSAPIHRPPSIGNQPAPLIPAQQSLFAPNKSLSGLNKIPDGSNT